MADKSMCTAVIHVQRRRTKTALDLSGSVSRIYPVTRMPTLFQKGDVPVAIAIGSQFSALLYRVMKPMRSPNYSISHNNDRTCALALVANPSSATLSYYLRLVSVSYWCLHRQLLSALIPCRSYRRGSPLTTQSVRPLFRRKAKRLARDVSSPSSGTAAASRRKFCLCQVSSCSTMRSTAP